MSGVKLLDCTLRDGGYYNDWNFSRPLVTSYLHAVGSARVDAVEIGFRFLPQDKFLGPFAYSTDEFLRTLPLPEGMLLGVMVNAKELLSFPHGAVKAVDSLFQDASASPVGLVRVAAHLADLDRCEAVLSRLKQQGYLVGLNLMQASERSVEQLQQAARRIQGWGTAEMFCLADSLGNMTPGAVQAAIRRLKEVWPGSLGVHTHNNMGQAVTNCLSAIEAGATWIDGSMLGMGRGAGNAQMEYLLLAMKERGMNGYAPEAVFPVVLEEFEQLRRHHGWGPNLLYHLSGSHAIHPSYIQEMVGSGRYEIDHILDALQFLKRSGAALYEDLTLQQAVQNRQGSEKGSWSADGWAKDRQVLLVARGQSTAQHLDALCRFIDEQQPLVVCLNVQPGFPPEKVTAYAACHRARLLMDLEKYRLLNKPLIAPLGAIPEFVRATLQQSPGLRILDYGMRVEPETFAVEPKGCVIPVYLVAAYVMALAEAGGASRILLAGFDGYDPADPRQEEMAQVLRCYQARPAALPLLAVTPTTYSVPKGSIYSPAL